MKKFLAILFVAAILLCTGDIFLQLFSPGSMGPAVLRIILPALAAFACAWGVGQLTAPTDTGSPG